MRIHLIRTHHSHWGHHSGIHQYIAHTDPDRFQFDVQEIEMGDGSFPITNKWLRYGIKGLVRLQSSRVYGLNDLLAEIAAGRQWWQGQIDLLHYLDAEHSLQFLPGLFHRFQSLKPRTPVVATFHQPPSRLDPLLSPRSIRHLDRVVVLAPEQYDYFARHLPPGRVSQILHGIDTGFFRPASPPPTHQGFRCISVGSWLRDYDAVLQVADRLQSQPEFEFHIVSRTVSVPAHLSNVQLHTGLDDEELRTLYQGADVLFLPVTDATANNALLEGIACGLPVVSTALPSIAAYVPETAAILIQDNAPDMLADALLRLYRAPGLRASMGRCARERALELSWEQIARQYEALYLEMVSQSRSGPGNNFQQMAGDPGPRESRMPGKG